MVVVGLDSRWTRLPQAAVTTEHAAAASTLPKRHKCDERPALQRLHEIHDQGVHVFARACPTRTDSRLDDRQPLRLLSADAEAAGVKHPGVTRSTCYFEAV